MSNGGRNTLTVIRDELATLNLSAASYTVNENAGTISIPVFRTGDLLGTDTVNYVTVDGSAMAPFDYASTSGTVTFAPGQRVASFPVAITFNGAAEGPESFTVTLSNSASANLGTQTSATVNIVDSPSSSPAITNATIFALTVNNRLVSFAANDPGTLTSGPTAISGLGAGESLLGIDFRPANGVLYGLSSASRVYSIDTASGAATVIGAPGAFALSGTAFGIDFNPVPARIRVTSDAGQNLRLNPDNGTLSAADGPLAYGANDINAGLSPAVVGSGYTNSFAGAGSTTLYGIDNAQDTLVVQSPPNAGTLSTVGPLGLDPTGLAGFDIGPSNKAFAALAPSGSAQLFTLNLTTGGATSIGQINVPEAIRGIAVALPGTITLSAATATVAENALGVPVTITRTGAGAASVAFTVTPGSASAGSDYTSPVTGRLSFAPGEVSRTITIPIVNDDETEPDETFSVTLSAPENATLGAVLNQAITITNDDAVRTLSIGSTTVNEGASEATFTVTLSRPSAVAVTFSYATADGTATSPADYASTSGTLTFLPGEVSKTIAVAVNDDAVAESNEAFTVGLSNSATTLATAVGTATIVDNEAPALTLTLAPATVSEAAGASASTGTVSRSTQDNSAALTVTLASGDTSEATVPATVTIPAGAASAPFAIASVNDATVDGSQQATITAAATGFSTASATLTVTDDESAQLSLSIAPSTVGESGSATGTVTRNTLTTAPLTVSLSSSDLTEASVPASVTIAAG